MSRTTLFWIVRSACVVWIGSIAQATPSKAAADVARLRDGARLVLEPPCGTCHNAERPSAKPAALKVFDLTEEQWQARMSDGQLRQVISRIRGTSASTVEQDRVAKFIRAELRVRASSRN